MLTHTGSKAWAADYCYSVSESRPKPDTKLEISYDSVSQVRANQSFWSPLKRKQQFTPPPSTDFKLNGGKADQGLTQVTERHVEAVCHRFIYSQLPECLRGICTAWLTLRKDVNIFYDYQTRLMWSCSFKLIYLDIIQEETSTADVIFCNINVCTCESLNFNEVSDTQMFIFHDHV